MSKEEIVKAFLTRKGVNVIRLEDEFEVRGMARDGLRGRYVLTLDFIADDQLIQEIAEDCRKREHAKVDAMTVEQLLP